MSEEMPLPVEVLLVVFVVRFVHSLLVTAIKATWWLYSGVEIGSVDGNIALDERQ